MENEDMGEERRYCTVGSVETPFSPFSLFYFLVFVSLPCILLWTVSVGPGRRC